MLSTYITQTTGADLSPKNTGMGNVLFQVCFTYGISRKYNLKEDYSELEKLLKILDSYKFSHRNTIYRNIKTDTNFLSQIKLKERRDSHQLYDNNLIRKIEIHKNKNIFIENSYLQSHKYFDQYRDEIQKLFEPDEDSLNYIMKKYPDFLDQKNKISIHLRLEWGGGISYKKDFLLNTVKYIRENITDKNINFYVFSDNIEKAKNILTGLEANLIFCQKNPDYIDMWMMSLCDHNILCHSTMGWWGAYLNKNKDKKVMYPRGALKLFHATLNPNPVCLQREEDYFMKDWIRIEGESIYR